MIFAVQPLISKDYNKQCCHDKIHTFCIEVDQGTKECTERAADDPVNVIQHGDKQIEPSLVHTVRNRGCSNQRIGLIGQFMDQQKLFLSGVFVFVDDGKTVEEMPYLDHQCHDRGGDQAGTACEQVDRHILHRAGINKDGHKESPDKRISVAFKQYAKAHTKKKIACHNRKCVRKGRPECFAFHVHFLLEMYQQLV